VLGPPESEGRVVFSGTVVETEILAILKLHAATVVLVLSVIALGSGVLDWVLPADNQEKSPEVKLADFMHLGPVADGIVDGRLP
jgi:hypothetical protein